MAHTIFELEKQREEARAELQNNVKKFRSAFEGHASPDKTLTRAWEVHRSWSNLRNVEGALHSLYTIRHRQGGTSITQPPSTASA